MKSALLYLTITLLLLNFAYLFRGQATFPYPTGDGLSRWMFVGKLISTDSLKLKAPPFELPYRDDYPLLIPLLVSFSYRLFGFSISTAMLPFILPYLLLTLLILYPGRSLLLALPLLSLPLLEQMSGRGQVGFADHFLAVFIAAALIFDQKRRFALSVFAALLAAHTKNEGQVFSLLLFLFNLKRPIYYLLPLNLLLWRVYLSTQGLTHFYLTTPGDPLTLRLILPRLPTLISLTLRSLFNPYLFSLAGPFLLFRALSQRLTRYHFLLGLQLLTYLLTFLITPTSIDYVSHFAVAVDRLLLHLLLPLLLL